MKRTLQVSIALAAVTVAGTAASAQTPTSTASSSSAGVLSSSTSTATAAKRKPTSATPDMINEAIQRSEARAAKETATGKPQQWGSEEPFAYNPAVKRFDATRQ
ncbi:MAG: hypothetical protein WDO17_21860 [Alphaproteobacteria bacterium]